MFEMCPQDPYWCERLLAQKASFKSSLGIWPRHAHVHIWNHKIAIIYPSLGLVIKEREKKF
jgi:hypothetical protein